MSSKPPKSLPPINDLALSATEIAWLAGLFEGEASFLLDKRSKTRYQVSTSPCSVYISIQMIDEDVIARVAQLLNKNYQSLTRKTSRNQPVYKVHIGDRATLRYLLPLLFPYLGNRRQQHVQLCLNALADWEIWYCNGGRSDMARIGPMTKKKLQ